MAPYQVLVILASLCLIVSAWNQPNTCIVRSSFEKDTRIDDLQTSVQLLDEKVTGLEEPPVSTGGGGGGGGVVYTRWGSRSCPDAVSTNLLYFGRTAGSQASLKGGASNYLCMPEAPEYGLLPERAGHQGGSGSVLEGIEYRDPVGGTNYADVACAVCTVTERSMQVMIPAITTCPPDWTEEYVGYLMSESSRNSYRTMYICVDSSLEFTPDTFGRTSAGFLYHVEPSCNQAGLPCGPFYNGVTELPCVLCTK